MARKLKTYVTQTGFFELAVAAPSMKAALEAWGMARNAFHQGFARETEDPGIIAAAMAKPGTVVKRAVGSTGDFAEKAELPTRLPVTTPSRLIPKSPPAKKPKPPAKSGKPTNSADILSFEKARAARARERARLDAEQARQAADDARAEEKRQKALDQARATLERAAERHAAKMAEIETARRSLDKKAEAEEARWAREKARLGAALRGR